MIWINVICGWGTHNILDCGCMAGDVLPKKAILILNVSHINKAGKISAIPYVFYAMKNKKKTK